MPPKFPPTQPDPSRRRVSVKDAVKGGRGYGAAMIARRLILCAVLAAWVCAACGCGVRGSVTLTSVASGGALRPNVRTLAYRSDEPQSADIYLTDLSPADLERTGQHPELGVVTISVWRDDRCVATHHVPTADVPDLMKLLTEALLEQPSDARTTAC